MFNLQVLALTLIPLLSPVAPGNGSDPYMDPLTLLDIEGRVGRAYLVGTWKHTKDFVKWGRADRNRAKVRPYRGTAYMSLYEDGSMRMVNLFQPEDGKWDLSEEGIIIYDPEHPERVSKIIPVRKRGQDFIWLILPFAGGASGIGMARVSHEELEIGEDKEPSQSQRLRSR